MKRFLMVAVLVMVPLAAGGQSGGAGGGAARTPWGDPNLQGVWDYWTFTPLERPKEFADKAVLTEQEAAAYAERLRDLAIGGDARAPRSGDPGAYSQETWTDRTKARALTQTAIIVDPSDGKLPPMTAEAKERAAAHDAGGGRPVRKRSDGIGLDGPEDRGLSERCILGFSTGPPMLPGGYNNNIQIFQSPTHVAILLEMNHDVRMVPIDGRPHLSGGVRQWLGDSRGRWEGDTLVVETTNFTHKTASFSGRVGATGFELGSAENLRLIERFTRTPTGALTYEFTVDDPSTFTRPFTGRFEMSASQDKLYEYACHEGNYGLLNILAGARAAERRR